MNAPRTYTWNNLTLGIIILGVCYGDDADMEMMPFMSLVPNCAMCYQSM